MLRYGSGSMADTADDDLDQDEEIVSSGKTDGITSSRWWEYYFVRYFVGSVIGSAVVLFIVGHLLAQSPQWFSAFISTLIPMAKDKSIAGMLETLDHSLLLDALVSAKTFFVIGAAGVAYCYLASSPMMILHACRAEVVDRANGKLRNFLFWIITVIGFVTIVGFALDRSHAAWAAALVFLAVLGSQVALIVRAAHTHFDSIKKFYRDLGKARANLKPRSGYVESYRHLREHSNAYAIIVLELLLAFVLANAPSDCLLAILILWLLPSVFCWFIATLLEFEFTRLSTEDAGSKTAPSDPPVS